MRKNLGIILILIITITGLFFFSHHSNETSDIDEYILNISDDLIVSSIDQSTLEDQLNQYLKELNQTVTIDVKYVDTTEAVEATNENVNNIAFVPSDSFVNFQLSHKYSNLQQLYVALENSASTNGTDELSIQSSNNSPYFIVSDKHYSMFANKNIKEMVNIMIEGNLVVATTDNPANYELVWLYYLAEQSDLDFNQIDLRQYDNNEDLFNALDNNEVDIILSTIPKYTTKNFSDDLHYLSFPAYQEVFLNPLIIYNQNITNEEEEAYSYFFEKMFSDPDILKTMNELLAWVNVKELSGTTNIRTTNQVIQGFKAYQKYLKEHNEDSK